MKLSTYNRVRYIGLANMKEQIKPGDIGCIVEDYGDGNYEVEFSDADGATRALVVIAEADLALAEK
ncbi:DUF4926 domain-containing protein [Burkholderia stagnalis]|uniref:DUF4926 domain-containing protein n=1 Tax=Burkholderia stagnalis TaxID=1503054 RepID=UPI0009C16034|nr:DUF4926 domain-containing protein [Burkholderia stagnalis]